MTSWADQPFVSFDIESTGVDPMTARIVTASLVTINGRNVKTREWLVDPGVEIPAEATAIHRITTEHARENGLKAAYAVAEIRQALSDVIFEGMPVVVFNAPYDLTLLAAECMRYDVPTLGELRAPLRVIDPLVLDRAMAPDRRGKGVRKLTYLCRNVYNVPLSEEDAHGSTADALAAARVAWMIASRYREVGAVDLDVLQADQRAWHIEWAVEFGAWLVTQGKVDDIDRHWPIRPLPSGELFAAPEAAPAKAGLL